MTGNSGLDTILNPKSIAVIGAYPFDPQKPVANSGWMFAKTILEAGFKGQMYLVHPRGGESQGYKIYPNIKYVPGPVDRVICCISARHTPQMVSECAEKGVKGIHFFTAGFSETGTEEGKQLEDEIVGIARRGGVRLIGPNCMGLYNPGLGIAFRADFPRESGRVGFICQSGGNAIYLVLLAGERGIRFSKVVSYGNACDVNESDLLEYFINDPETDIITMYIEGVKEGKRFKRLLQEATKIKPVIAFKGGYTQAGARAASSHTGSLAGASEVWDGLMQQCGVVQARSIEEMSDLVLAFQHLAAPGGRRIGPVGIGGGATVVATDIYSLAGLSLPSLPKDLRQNMIKFVTTDAGLSLNNPVDISGGYGNWALYNVGKTLAEYEGIDVLVVYLPFTNLAAVEAVQNVMLEDIRTQVTRIRKEITKPMIVVLYGMYNAKLDEKAYFYQKKFHEAGIPTYFPIESAAAALNKYIAYFERLKDIK